MGRDLQKNQNFAESSGSGPIAFTCLLLVSCDMIQMELLPGHLRKFLGNVLCERHFLYTSHSKVRLCDPSMHVHNSGHSDK